MVRFGKSIHQLQVSNYTSFCGQLQQKEFPLTVTKVVIPNIDCMHQAYATLLAQQKTLLRV